MNYAELIWKSRSNVLFEVPTLQCGKDMENTQMIPDVNFKKRDKRIDNLGYSFIIMFVITI